MPATWRQRFVENCVSTKEIAEKYPLPERIMNLQGSLAVPERAFRRLARFPAALRRLSSEELSALLGAFGPQPAIQSAAAKLRGGWVNDDSMRKLYNTRVIAAQEGINDLVSDATFKAKLDSINSWSDDSFVLMMHAVTDALLYAKNDTTSPLIETLYGPFEKFYPWDSLGQINDPDWLSPPGA
jgi:hypothetical protein